jgi:hypothetical protein
LSEPQTMSIEALGPTPRAGQFGDKPGSYKLAVRTVTPEVDPGERMIMKVMKCGYGEIAGTKLAVYPSPDSYVPEESSILHGLKRDGTLIEVRERNARIRHGRCDPGSARSTGS